MAQRGAFVVIEGLDRSGKTTQTEIIRKLIQEAGKEVVCIKFPDRTTPIGQMIDSYLRSHSDLDDHVVHLLFSANRWELASAILGHLDKGKIVLCDRYAFSGIAFSVAKSLPLEPESPHLQPVSSTNLPAITLPWARAPDASLPAPDLTLFLDISPEAARNRGGYGEERYEKASIQRRVRKVFEELGREINGDGKWIVVDAGQDMSTVTENMWGNIQPLLNGFNSPIGRLWK
ncbi:P-loop containing nucleoside triphosphate hydrolase protein [Rhodocollybia butyracea]|uniref:Thymidylate kinase n=1 Tax=Rhodocollybia butyracea TaxID=206335 RepID=A0A9P5UDJ6_9AGAR|nr:P-loop containing nucleoside triphosphate hydrolase protein [Rhodocollybia butyracea]